MTNEIIMKMSGKIRKNCKKDFKQAIENVIKKRECCLKKDENSQGFLFVDYFFKSNGNILYNLNGGFLNLGEYTGDFEDTEEFVRFISLFIEPEDIEFSANQDKWGFRIRDNGYVVELKYGAYETGIFYEPLITCSHKHSTLKQHKIKNIIPNELIDIEFAKVCDGCNKIIEYERQIYKFHKKW